jgi:protease PrsW
LAWLLLAVVFAAIWTYAFYREDRHRPEPLWMVLLAVATGCAGFFVADHVEARLLPHGVDLDGSFWSRARIAFLVAGPVEESIKFLGVLIAIRPWAHFDETMDGIVYGAAAGAGFALMENLAFMQGQPELILSRGPAGTGAHVLFAMFWGGALGFAGHITSLPRRILLAALGLLVAVLAHGAFDLVAFSVERELTMAQGRVAQIVLLLICMVCLRVAIRTALKLRPFRYREA